ncbi:MAG: LPS export ABC transporter periplasmic protein LptC [Desulfovibrionaceae bacterium]|jgi:LPS export ABC transporter protein LptC|nr:LPS export ABC transporter periplasmic protein LptC [Desulfovibrionaceae bacterium]
MLRRILVTVLLLAAAGGGLAWYVVVRNPVVEQVREAVKDSTLSGALDVDLTLRGLDLTHGEQGRAQWRLTAKAAQYLQDSGTVKVDNPSVVYYFEKGGGNMTVAASQGLVLQDRKQARLWPDVEGRYQDNVLRAGELFYNGTSESLTLADGVYLQGDQFACNATRMRVDLKTNEIVADQGVSAVLYLGDRLGGPSAGQSAGPSTGQSGKRP